MLFDVGLPDMDGREAVKLLRKSGFKSPIIMLTANDLDADQILGLDAGANDYITKPFKFAVLLARIRAQLRQHEQSEDAVFAIGHYTFKPASKLLLDERGAKIRLTEKETSILKYLYRAGEKVVTRDVLLHEVWGYNAGVTTHTLETHIYRLRQKIEKDPRAPSCSSPSSVATSSSPEPSRRADWARRIRRCDGGERRIALRQSVRLGLEGTPDLIHHAAARRWTAATESADVGCCSHAREPRLAAGNPSRPRQHSSVGFPSWPSMRSSSRYSAWSSCAGCGRRRSARSPVARSA